MKTIGKFFPWYFKGFRWLKFYDQSVEMSNTDVFLHGALTGIIVGVIAFAL